MRRYLRCNINGQYEIAFLPKGGGLDEQEWDWVEEIDIITRALNKAYS